MAITTITTLDTERAKLLSLSHDLGEIRDLCIALYYVLIACEAEAQEIHSLLNVITERIRDVEDSAYEAAMSEDRIAA